MNPPVPVDLDILVEQSKDGNKLALEELVRRIQNPIYNLALRMLWHPTDAEDATQDILVKVITHLSQFRAESTFTTWVYRIASNHLLTGRKRQAELKSLNFAAIGAELEQTGTGVEDRINLVSQTASLDENLLYQEVRLRCTLGMLLCLDREARLIYLLSESFGLSSSQGAYVLEISEAAYRKRLSRARQRLRTFMRNRCGLIEQDRECGCIKSIQNQNQAEKKHLANLLAANSLGTTADPALQSQANRIASLDRMAALFQNHPTFNAPDRYAEAVKSLITNNRFEILDF